MIDLINHIRTQLSDYSDTTFFVACSGGVDSLTLLYAAHKAGFTTEAIHINYQLRGEDSLLDQTSVQEFCNAHSIPCHVHTVDLNEQLQSGGNLQELARTVRYDVFSEFVQQQPRSKVLLGHHKQDQVETFLLNIARKSGVMGLSAMPFERSSILRPFLTVSKHDILVFARQHSLNWREDQSNQSIKYRRNLLRNKLIPEIEASIPSFSNSVLQLVNAFQATQQELEQSVQQVLDYLKANSTVLIKEYQSLTEFEQIEFLRQVGINASYQSRIFELCQLDNGKRVSLTHPVFKCITKREKHLYFVLQDIQKRPALEKQLVTKLPSTFSKDYIYLDSSLIQGELTLRYSQQGDRIHSLGMRGSQLISDIVKDAKLSPHEKEQVLVLHDDTTIHWCVGLKIGRRAIANNQSKEILQCSVTWKTIP